MMRVLHTGDWHLGASTGGVSRTPDFLLLFEWLRDVIRHEAVDVLVIAGDVFEHAQPSAEALTLYYDLLASLAATSLRAVLIVGGNHDSASRLDAPRGLLSHLHIHVVGGMPAGILEAPDAQLASFLYKVDDVVFAAVPYVHEYRLGVRRSATSEADVADVRTALGDAFRALYRRLAELAAARWPDARLVATGHLVAAGARPGDWGMHIHQVGLLGALPADIFDARFAYVALGHLHRSFAVAPSVWYCGSPVALTLEEADTPRRVMLVELGAEVTIMPREVPKFRDILSFTGTPEVLATALASVRSSAPLPPLVQVRADVEGYTPTLEKGLAAALQAANVDARLIGLRQARPDDPELVEPLGARVPSRLADLDPEAVFLKLAQVRGEPLDAALLDTFRGLLAETAS